MAILAGFINFIKNLNMSFLEWELRNGRILLDYFHVAFDKLFYVFLYITIGLSLVYLVLSFFALFSKKRYNEKGLDLKDAPFITVQIPTRNELIALRCAEKCLDFDYPKDRYEILIGDDSSDRSVSKKLMEFAKLHERVRVIKRKQNTGFKPGNLNNLLRHSNGEFIVIFDSDFTPANDFLKRIIAPFLNDRKVSAVQARWNFNNFNQNFVTVLASTIVYAFHYIVLTFMDRYNSGSLCGSAEAVRKSDLIKLGGWVSGSLTEDVEYSLRLHKANKRIVYLQGLECYSDVPFKAKDLYKQQMRWAYGVIAAYLHHSGSIFSSRALSARQKLLSVCAGFGYTWPVMIMLLFMFGILSFVTNKPAPVDLPKFFSELGMNVLLTSGLTFASLVTLYKAKKIRYSLKMLLSSFSVGIATTYYVNKGIAKSILKRPMEWYLLDKNIYYTR